MKQQTWTMIAPPVAPEQLSEAPRSLATRRTEGKLSLLIVVARLQAILALRRMMRVA
jgi:hypothetical protein